MNTLDQDPFIIGFKKLAETTRKFGWSCSDFNLSRRKAKIGLVKLNEPFEMADKVRALERVEAIYCFSGCASIMVACVFITAFVSRI